MVLTLVELRDNMERQFDKVNKEMAAKYGDTGMVVEGTAHTLPKPDHPLETRRHIGDTPRSAAPATGRTAKLSKSQRLSHMQAKLERAQRRRLAAEAKEQELRSRIEMLSTGYSAYGRVGRKDDKYVVPEERKEELRKIKRTYHLLGLEHERRRVLAHAEADKKAHSAKLRAEELARRGR